MGKVIARALRQILQKLPGTLQITQATLGKVETLADALGPTLEALRRRRRRWSRHCSRRSRSCADRRRSSATSCARSRAPRCRRSRSCGRRCATSRRRRRTSPRVQRRQQAAEQLAYNPPGDREGLPVLALVGQPPRRRDVRDPGRARPDPPRPRHPSCPTAQLLDASRQANPQLGTLVELLNAPAAERSARLDAGSGGGRMVERRAPPSAGSPRWCSSRCRASGCCCSCGSRSAARSAQAEGLPLPDVASPRRRSWQEADVRISGVPVGKVKTIEPDKQTGRARVVIELDVEVRAAAVRREGDPAPEDAARRDLRRAHAGLARREPIAEGGDARAGAGVRRRSSSTRSCARSTRRRARRSRTGCSRRRRRSTAAGAISTTRSATSARSPRTRPTLVSSSTASRARSPPDRQHRRRLRRADRARRAAALADRELQHGLRDHGGARRSSCRPRSARCRRSRRSPR